VETYLLAIARRQKLTSLFRVACRDNARDFPPVINWLSVTHRERVLLSKLPANVRTAFLSAGR